MLVLEIRQAGQGTSNTLCIGDRDELGDVRTQTIKLSLGSLKSRSRDLDLERKRRDAVCGLPQQVITPP